MVKKILILDDDKDISALMDILLRREGYETVAAYSFEIFEDQHAINSNLILQDNRLGDGFGKDYCRQLKKDPGASHFKIVLLSVAADLESIAADCKADAFLPKPFGFAKLATIVDHLTSFWRLTVVLSALVREINTQNAACG